MASPTNATASMSARWNKSDIVQEQPSAQPQAGWTALVLAGARGGADPVARTRGVSHKALAPIAGIPMLERVLDALQASQTIDHIALCGPWDSPHPPQVDDLAQRLQQARPGLGFSYLVPQASPARSAAACLEHLALPVLLTTADHALLTPAIIDSFCATASHSQLDLAVGLVPHERVSNAFPDSRRTRLRFVEGAFCGANLFALRHPKATEVVSFWRQLEDARKQPFTMARRLGLGTLLGYVLGRLSLSRLLRRLSARFGLRLGVVVLDDPEAAVDVDSLDDLALVEHCLARRPTAR